MIVGTAGHIDHGKTTLVRALTGVDTDRLPEEKQRGISIELGYAYLELPREAEAASGEEPPRIGFIDVPGHERLVHTMLAGATGIDHALLLVAADDGVMPQTAEHLAVLSLLGIAQGAIVLTKADRADAARLAEVEAQARALVAPTALAEAPLFALSALSGDGVQPLREHLFAAARAQRRVQRARSGAAWGFRLAIDRAFTLGGVGTVVTGTVHAGRVAVGDELVLTPNPRGTGRLRVRSLHAQNREVQQAEAGQRCAVGLAGVAKDEVQRGQWLVPPQLALATQRLDARLRLWHGESRPLRSGTAVHVHLGSAATTGSVAVLAPGEALAPGGEALVQVLLREPLAAWYGDAIVLRDASASRTLAGGRVLDPFAPVRYRRTPQRLAELAAWSQAAPAARRDALLQGAPQGVDLQRWQLAEGLLQTPPLDGATTLQEGDWALAEAHAESAAQALHGALSDYHRAHPDELGPEAARARRLACPRLPEALWRALLRREQQAARLALKGAWLHLPAHGAQLSSVDQRIAQKLGPLLEAAGYEGAWVRDLSRDAHESEPLLRVTIARLAQRGELHQVVRDLVYPASTMQRLALLARELAAADAGEVTAARYRDATQLGRKRAIQILEYLDRVGLLRRVGDVHRLRSDSLLFST